MKKLILVVSFGLTGWMSANTVKEHHLFKEEMVQLCGVRVNFYDSEGNLTSSQWIVSDQPTLIACQNWQVAVKVGLRLVGFTVQDESLN